MAKCPSLTEERKRQITEKVGFPCEVTNLDTGVKGQGHIRGPVCADSRKITNYTNSHFFEKAVVTEDQKILARQHIYLRKQAANGATKVIWSIFNLGECLRMPSDEDRQTRKLQSSVFTTQDGSAWMLELRPKTALEFQAKLVLHAIRTPHEREMGTVNRKVLIKPIVHRATVKNLHSNGPSSFERDVEEAFFIASDEEGTAKMDHTVLKFLSFLHKNAENNQMTKCLVVEVSLTPKVFIAKDHQVYKDNLTKKNANERVSRNFFQDVEVGDDTTGFKGLINEGSTCYINSLLQMLYSLGGFRSSIYRLNLPQATLDNPLTVKQLFEQVHSEQSRSLMRCLQRIFYNLQVGRDNVRTYELLKALNFTDRQMKLQQDASEF